MDEKGKDSGSGAESDHLGQDLGTPITAPAMLFLPGSAMERAKARLLLLKFWRKTLAFVRSMGVGPEIAWQAPQLGCPFVIRLCTSRDLERAPWIAVQVCPGAFLAFS